MGVTEDSNLKIKQTTDGMSISLGNALIGMHFKVRWNQLGFV